MIGGPIKHSLLLMVAVLGICVAANGQEAKPITKSNLFSSVQLGKKEKKTAARYIELIKQAKVDFLLTDADEKILRQYGSYLGKQGLDDLIAAIQANYHGEKSAAASSVMPTEAPKLDGPTFSETIETVAIWVGGMGTGYSVKQLEQGYVTPINIAGFVPFRLMMDKGKLYVSVAIYNANGLPPIEMRDNDLTLRPSDWDRNSNNAALEVVNAEGRPVFQMIYERPNRIRFNGLFTGPGFLLQAEGEKTVVNPNPATLRSFSLKPIFKYPSWKYPGQYAEPQETSKPSSINQTMTNSPGGIQAGRDVIINQGRQLTEDQRKRFLTAARSSVANKGLIVIEVPMGDSEAYKFAMQLDSVLREAGWETSVGQNGYDGLPIGLIMLARDKDHIPETAGLLQYAFREAGLRFQAVFREDVQPGNIHLIVGARPPGD